MINKESRYNFFVNPDTSFNELVDYSRDAISTGMTVYSAARFSHSLLESISISSTPAAVTPFGQLAPSTVNIAIDAGLAGNLFRSSGFWVVLILLQLIQNLCRIIILLQTKVKHIQKNLKKSPKSTL